MVVRSAALHALRLLLQRLPTLLPEGDALLSAHATMLEELRRRLPDVQVVLSLRQRCIGSDRLSDLMLGSLLEIVCLYRRHVPRGAAEVRCAPI